MARRFDFNELKEALAATAYFVETGDSYTQLALWQAHHEHAEAFGYPKLAWEQVSRGFLEKVGPVTMCSFSFAYISGQLVCFYMPTSKKVDWDEVETFLERYYGDDNQTQRRRMCNAMNFGHCIGYLRK